MLQFVLTECEKVVLYTPLCAFDGQWYRLAVRDKNEFPLILVQLQKELYQEVRRMTINQVLIYIVNMNIVQCTTLAELTDFVNIEIGLQQRLAVGTKRVDDSLKIYATVVKMISDWRNGKHKKMSRSKFK